MKKTAVSVLLILSLTGCSTSFTPGLNVFTPKKGNGKETDVSFFFDGSISKIDISHVFATVIISPESSREITYVIDENLKELLVMTYSDSELKITTKDENPIRSDVMTFNIGADALEKIVVNGATSIKGHGIFTADKFDIKVEGAADIELALNVNSVSVEELGAARITLTGKANEMQVNGLGTSFIKTRDLIAQDVAISLTGAGNVEVYAEKTLDVSVTGVGTVTYWGNPELSKSALGIASVRKGG